MFNNLIYWLQHYRMTDSETEIEKYLTKITVNWQCLLQKSTKSEYHVEADKNLFKWQSAILTFYCFQYPLYH